MALLAQVSTGMTKENGTMAETYSVAMELGPDLPGWWEIKDEYNTFLVRSDVVRKMHQPKGSSGLSLYTEPEHGDDNSCVFMRNWTMDDAKDFLLAIHGKLTNSNEKIKPWPGPPNPEDSSGQAGEESMAKLYTDFFNRVERLSRVRSVGPYPPDWE